MRVTRTGPPKLEFHNISRGGILPFFVSTTQRQNDVNGEGVTGLSRYKVHSRVDYFAGSTSIFSCFSRSSACLTYELAMCASKHALPRHSMYRKRSVGSS